MAMSGIEQDAIVARLDEIIRRVALDVATVPKYGGVLYTLKPQEKEGQFCGVFPYKEHVQLTFSHGVALRDPAGGVTGTGKARRHVNFASLDAIDPDVLAGLMDNAVEHSRMQGEAK